MLQIKGQSSHFNCAFSSLSQVSLPVNGLNEYVVFYSEPLLVLIEYVPYGDLLGYLRKSRGLNDTYFKDPDIKPQTSLTSQQLMKFSWQVADGMSYLSSRSVSWNIWPLCIQISLVQTVFILQTKIILWRMYSGLLTFSHFLLLRFDKPPLQWRFHKMYVRLDLCELRADVCKISTGGGKN